MNKKIALGLGLVLALAGFWTGRTAWRSYHKLVTLTLRNAPLAEVVKRIERQTGEKVKVDPNLDARITLDVRNMKLPKVLDLVSEQAGALWATAYAVYHDKHSLHRLEPLLVAKSSDGDLESAGWTNLAPKYSPTPMPDGDGPILSGRPGSELSSLANAASGSNAAVVLHGANASFQNTEDVKKIVDDLVKQGAEVKQSDDGSMRTVTMKGAGTGGGRIVMMNSGGKIVRKGGGIVGSGDAGQAVTVRRMIGPGGVMTTATDNGGAVQIMRTSADGKILQEDIWSPERLVLETGLTSRLGDAIPTKASQETAAQTARKVQGKLMTYFVLDKSPVPIDPSMGRLVRSSLQRNLDSHGTNQPLAEGDVRGMLENEARQRRLDALAKTPEEQVQRARLKQAAQSPK